MLPLGVLAKKLVDDPSGRNRLIGALLAMVLLVGAFASGLSINIQFGNTGDPGQRLAVTSSIDPTTGQEVFTDGDGNVLDEQAVADLGITPATGGDSGGGIPSRSGSAVPAAAASAGGATPAPGSPAASGAPAAAAATPAPTLDPCAAAQLGETDQGVTAENIKLGVLVPNLNELELAGFPVGLAGDFDKIMTAWLNDWNKTGVACRQVSFVKRVFDVTSTDDMLKVCREMTQDEKVFSVVTPGGYDSVGQLCIAKDAKTPLLNAEPEPAAWYRDAAPYLWTHQTSKDRGHINHVRYLVEHGHLDGSQKIGVIYDGVPHVAPATETGLLPELERNGLEPTRVFKLSSDVEQALGQINQVVVDFQLAGVDFVFMPMNLIYKTQFMTAAENQNYFPQYTDSDHNFGCYDFTTSTYPARSFDGTLCVTSYDAYGRVDLEEYANTTPWAQHADAVYFATYPEGYHENGEGSDEWITQRALHLAFGSVLESWRDAAQRTGPNLTRPAWGAAMGQTGDFTKCVCEQPLRFEPDKWDGMTTVKGLIWHAEESDGYPERWFHELTRPQPAYVQKFIP